MLLNIFEIFDNSVIAEEVTRVNGEAIIEATLIILRTEHVRNRRVLRKMLKKKENFYLRSARDD